ncbi:MAG: M3 family metallopeptidase [Candidatus Brocadiaceae bacterium]|nr:M3 family metallopeptidase [Candidatus Brocadiaceae bacterium]
MKKISLYYIFRLYPVFMFCLIGGYSPKTVVADTFNVVSTLPYFETTPSDLEASIHSTLAELDKEVLCFKKNSSGRLTFQNTLGTIDDINYEISKLTDRISVIKNTTTHMALQQKAKELLNIVNQWFLNFEAQKDIYELVTRYSLSEQASRLQGEEKRLLDETIREFKRMGFHLNDNQFEQLKKLKADIYDLSQEIISNLNQAGDEVIEIAKEEASDIDPEILKSIQSKNGNYLIHKGNWEEITIFLRNSSNEALRKRIFRVYRKRAREKNINLQLQVFKKRIMIANLLGYKSWADYKIEESMAKNPENVLRFEENLLKNTEEKFQAEIEELRKIKIEETGNKDAKINSWDVAYYQTKYVKRNFNVDYEKLKKFFEYENTLAGMIKCYEQVFHLKIEKIKDIPNRWHHSMELLYISDAQTGKPLGFLYLDMFPRKGKSGSFSHHSIIRGKLLKNGKYRRPVGILICNFPAPSKHIPSLLSWENVKTLFHEFGHGLHNILTETKFYKFSGTSVPRDFVEAPSQMLEYFIADKRVLDTFAKNYQNPEEKISHEMLNNILKAEKTTVGQLCRIQIMLGILDLKLSMLEKDTDFNNFDIVHYTNTIIKNYYLPYPEGTCLIANFRHPFIGYDGGYYGYAWADCLAADMASIFETSKEGFLNPTIGLRLRREIYEKGSSRDVEKSVREFLGRKTNQDAFKKKLGIWDLEPLNYEEDNCL